MNASILRSWPLISIIMVSGLMSTMRPRNISTSKLISIGTKVRYSQAGAQLLDKPRSNECSYAVYDPQTNAWSKWKFLEMPDTEAKFYLVCLGCVQWLVKSDGTLLVPVYFRGPSGSDYSVTVLQLDFDGDTLRYLKHGDELARA